ncbi:MAG: type IX secretion system outer membrane channel protein PorV [Bacteroidales bacterium]|nr:type IX secretion system outer membrane channel protein PorV [Bacteroidales bacterium]
MKKLTFLTLLMALGGMLSAQSAYNEIGQNKNYISTGMPILLIAPDAISAAMGDAGVASTPDAYSAHWNNAKFAFIEGTAGVYTTYTPWLRKLRVGDMNLFYLGGYYRINDRSTAAASLTYFTLGDIDMTDVEGQKINTLHPNEFAIDATYALKLSDNLSLGATGRYIRSDLTNGQTISEGSGNTTTQAANSLAADIGLYYQQGIDKSQEFALGLFISNLGAKLSYSNDDNDKEFLPANLRFGGRYTNRIDDYNKISFLLDFNKLLVPTPPYTKDGVTYPSQYANNFTEYNNIGVIQGAIQSFHDAPGGFQEEIHEVQISAGAEYWYAETFAFRAGYFYEHETKGGRQYATVGFGIRYNYFSGDFAYLIPTTTVSTNSLANTIRISIGLDMKPTK